MTDRVDYVGRVFGKLTVLNEAGRDRKGIRLWNLLCSCGKTHTCYKNSVTSGNTKSCGCMKGYKTHGLSKHPVCISYKAAKDRCTKPNMPNYKDYGGRGIEFRLGTPDEFLDKMMPTWFKGASIDRINNEGHYEYSNVRWVTQKEQNRNKRSNVSITYYMVTLTLADWAEELGISPKGFAHRVKAWGIERAITTRVIRNNRRIKLNA